MKETVRAVTEGQTVSEGNFTDLTAINKEAVTDTEDVAAEAAEAAKDIADTMADIKDEAADSIKAAAEGKVEEFFNDED